jgi:hypothetical protein
MAELHPQFQRQWERGVVTWTGTLQPTALSATYTVRVQYRLGNAPRVMIIWPQLRPRDDTKVIPHVYGLDRPCLYYPKFREWHPGASVAETIVPWTSLWLHYYELWHATGEWLGGGIHIGSKKRARIAARSPNHDTADASMALAPPRA